jgi:hypothetical protein
MVANQVHDFPADVQRTYQRFVRWRSSHRGRLPIPEPLWAAAAELARKRGISTTAKVLRLEYGKLKEKALALEQGEGVECSRTARNRVGSGRRQSQPRPPAFVELSLICDYWPCSRVG